jgi:alkylated DNA nucleotide flippase Atl1
VGKKEPGGDLRQRFLLEKEGVRFDDAGRLSLARYRWNGRRA